MQIAVSIFDKFTDIDLWLMWDLFNRVRIKDWSAKILGEKEIHLSATNIEVKRTTESKKPTKQMQFCSSADQARVM